MALTKITTGEITDGTIVSADIAAGTITSADMAVDPTNASNLTSGSVPLAQLGNAPATDTTSIEDDIALLGFRIAANGSLAKYNLDDQIVDAFQDATGVDAAASTNEIFSSLKYFSGDADAPTGGLITTHGSYTVHSFLTTSNFIVNGTGSGTTVDYLVVGGGGSGGHGPIPGGGGAGGFLTGTGHTVSAQNYTITVGVGGTVDAGSGSTSPTKNGGNSIFSTITSIGGGGGANYPSAANAGGSGGGASGYTDGYGAGTPGQGFRGAPNSNPAYGAGGGGGAGEVGFQPPQTYGGDGGDGLQNDFRTGSNVWYAGGGGGARWTGGTGGVGGQGGGGNGEGSTPQTAATANTGGGAGGGGMTGLTGGSGIVVIRFTTGTLESDADMTLVSTATTALSVPTKSDIVLTHTNGAGTTVLNTDLIASVSRDGGTTYTAATLVNQGLAGGHNIATAHDFSIAAQPSGSSMKWKVQTVNQTVSKKTRLQAISMGWS